jgi:glycosyltransferase involved in cell wall biosynthesis
MIRNVENSYDGILYLRADMMFEEDIVITSPMEPGTLYSTTYRDCGIFNDQIFYGTTQTMLQMLTIYEKIDLYHTEGVNILHAGIALKHHMDTQQIKLHEFPMAYTLDKNRRVGNWERYDLPPHVPVRILFYATYPDQPIGYGKVAHMLSNYLAGQPNTEVYYFGISNVPELAVQRDIHPNIKFIDVLAEEKKIGSAEEYGVDIIDKFMREIKPHVFFVYNDIIVTCRLFNALLAYRAENPLVKFVSYLDLVYPYERPEYVQHVNRNTDLIFVFSECWKQNLVDMGVPAEKIRILYHGFNEEIFSMVPLKDAKVDMGFKEDDFFVLNVNRNTYRKALDISIAAFVKFLMRENFDPRIKMYMTCHLKTKNGYDLENVLLTECLRNKIPFELVNGRVLTPGPTRTGKMPDELINGLYNACDVGINTCTGEGFGLCNMEHAALGRPQIVSGVGALVDVFGGEAAGNSVVVKPRATFSTTEALDGHSGDQSVCSADDFAEALSFYFRNPKIAAEHGTRLALHMRGKYHWPTILERFRTETNEFFKESSSEKETG